MKRRFLAAALALIMVLGLVPVTVFAAVYTSSDHSSFNLISEKSYEIAPGIMEYEIYKNSDAMDSQQTAHVMIVTADSMESGESEVRVGYNDYDIQNIASGKGWGMKKTTEQAQAMETRAGVNVVGAVNGDFFNMANGQPTGVFVLDGTIIQKNNSFDVVFWVDSSGAPHITDYDTINSQWDNVREALGGNAWLVQDGEVNVVGGDASDNPRTAVGLTANNDIVLFMVNGRQAPFSDGMTIPELAAEMADLGCVVAMNLDGGGSSTFATQRAGEEENGISAGLTVRCRPSDGYERTVSSTLMVVSTAQKNGVFTHATIAPYEDIYTPGSTVRFTATGVDAGGGPAPLPGDLVWSVEEGETIGTITESGVFTGAEGATGTATIVLSRDGTEVGKTTIRLQWPDELGFTNTSISLDFGDESDLSFNPTYQGRPVHYKDGDFAWSVDPEYYKHFVNVEEFYNQFWPIGWMQIQITLTGNIDGKVTGEYRVDGGARYITEYAETSKEVKTLEDGTIQVSETITHIIGKKYGSESTTFDFVQDVTEDTDNLVRNLQHERTETFTIGKFVDNKFQADADSSLRGKVSVNLANDSDKAGPSGSVDVVVGLEPVVIMDFEGHEDMSAENYWTIKAQNTMPSEMAENRQFRDDYRVWIRDINNLGRWPSLESGDAYENGIVSKEEDGSVRFGDHAMRLAWDYAQVDPSVVAAACFGFTTPLMVDDTQPTKIGVWINVPRDLANSESVVKAILAAGASVTDAADDFYWKLNADNELEKVEGHYLAGATSYVQYYSYDSEGNVTGEYLGDWAGKGWTWIEADVSALQFPLEIQSGYTVRIVSAQNKVKDKGYVLIDNLQLIYGSNTNDINDPVIEGVSETSGTGATLSPLTPVAFDKNELSFEVLYNDSASTDKYATGIDLANTRVFIDGEDVTDPEKVFNGNMLVSASGLVNGNHILKVQLRDNYGNSTVESYPFEVNVENGTSSELSVVGAPYAQIGRDYTIQIGNRTSLENVKEGTVTLEIPAAYAREDMYTVEAGEGYTIMEQKLNVRAATLTVTAKMTGMMELSLEDVALNNIATVTFHIPETVQKGDTFTFSVPAATYKDISNNSVTFAQPQDKVLLTADYSIEVDRAVQGFDSRITVIDDETGDPISGAEVKFYNGDTIGTTDDGGVVIHKFTNADRQIIYATTGGDTEGRSWNTPVVVNARGADQDVAYKIQNNGSRDGATSRSLTWLSLIGDKETAETKLRYATSADALKTEATEVTGTNDLISFTQPENGVSYRLNTVKIDGLTSNTAYCYQVQREDGSWTEVRSFTTASAAKDASTSFFVFGDIQTTDTANLEAAAKAVSGQSGERYDLPTYSFGIQTGDAIDQVTQFDNYWKRFFGVMNADNLGGIDVLHTMGNHEYYGDSEGLVAGSIFDLPKTEQGAWYSVEYGSVYAAVVNNGGDLGNALQEIAQDAALSDCVWKVLVLHEPIYGTAEDMDAETRLKYTSLIEEGGFSVVFSGDDHSYARTYPIRGGEKLDADSSDGVVYYISGDLSGKNNEFHNYDHFAKAVPHTGIDGQEGYGSLFLSVTADKDQMTISAYKVPEFTLEESYSRVRTDCQKGSHTYDEDSLYDMTGGEFRCSICGKGGQEPDSNVNGLRETLDGGYVIFASGEVKKDGFTMIGTDMYHSCEDGHAYRSTDHDPRDCTHGGYITYECPKCHKSEQSEDYQMPVGHKWDADHKCTVCGTIGKNIEDPDVIVNFGTVENPRQSTTIPDFVLIDGGIRPAAFVSVDGGKTALTSSNDDRLDGNGKIRDIKISWINSTTVGVATIEMVGRGDYYGTRTLAYRILPGNVEDLEAALISITSVQLTWKAALGAGYYQVYQCDKDGTIIKEVANTEKTSCEVTGLEYNTDYYYKAAARTKVDGETYNSAYWSNIVTVTTPKDPTEESRVFIIDGAMTSGETSANKALIDGTWYYFLPSSADLTQVKLDIMLDEARVIGTPENVIVSGSKGSKDLNVDTGTIDVTALADETDGGYPITFRYGETRSKIPVIVMKSANIPAMFLTSKVEGQDRSYVDASRSNTTVADMKLVGVDGMVIYSGELEQLKAHGNSTFIYAKNKSYQIKLPVGAGLLETNEEVTTWVLLANYSDATKIRDKVIKDFSTGLGMPYVASSGWVDLYYDGEYRGTYLLSEKNSVSPTGVDITDMEAELDTLNENYGVGPIIQSDTNAYGQEYRYTTGLVEPENVTGGYLIELNRKEIDEASGFMTSRGEGFNVKSPEYAGKKAMEYISEYYQEFEDAVYAVDESGNHTGYNTKTGKYYYDYVDLESLIQVFLIQELVLNPDGFHASMYFYKDMDGIMYAGPIWDHDLAFGTGWSRYISSDVMDYHYLQDALIRIPGFKDALIEYYNKTFAPAARNLISADGMVNTYVDTVRKSVDMNNVLWQLVKVSDPTHAEHFWPEGTTYDDVVNTMIEWIDARIAILDELYKPAETPDNPDDPGTGETTPGTGETTPGTGETTPGTGETAPGTGETTPGAGETTPGTGETTPGIGETTPGSGGITGGGQGGGADTPVAPGNPGSGSTTPVTNPDGSTTATKKNADGSVTETTKQPDGTVTEKVIQTDGSATEKTTTPEGITGQVDTDSNGRVKSVEVVIPKDANRDGIITVPVEIPAAKDAENAPEISFKMGFGESAKVEIPVTRFGPGTVAVIVHEDGTEQVVRDCVIGENGVIVNVEGDMTFKIVDKTQIFADVQPKDHWSSDAVEFVAARELFNGTGNNMFSPDGEMTRGMLVTVLHRLAYEPEQGSLNFSDVDGNAYYAHAVAWASENDIVNGYGDGTFRPEKNITRDQMVTILYRYARKAGYITDVSASLSGYADADKVEDYATEAMAWAVGVGLIQGKDASHLDPLGGATRGEVATILMRFCDRIING